MKMGSMCCKVSGFLVLLSGLMFFLYGWGMIKDGMMVHMVAGGLLALYGLAKLVHSMDMCPACTVEEPKSAAKKR
ncbi:hypothetical protein HY994_04075 [Candidatus Micrarchaeota archaeon]|nr:hypothetical protein [Candidatus Micrarchaeota archaeon]